MGVGIAIEFRKRFKLSGLQDKAKKEMLEVGSCYKVGRVHNLVTKAKYWQKPTCETVTSSLNIMKEICLKENITRIAMSATVKLPNCPDFNQSFRSNFSLFFSHSTFKLLFPSFQFLHLLV